MGLSFIGLKGNMLKLIWYMMSKEIYSYDCALKFKTIHNH